jgi:hypothetical protein
MDILIPYNIILIVIFNKLGSFLTLTNENHEIH